ncbi:MAG: thioesterase family protein [Myxococcota bacterium]|nr:thioesterase family protein [Myxococcota bacterium]
MAAAGEPEAVYQIEGDRIVPSLLSQGPWDPNGQHGGAVCALLARTLEREPTLVAMRFARISFDLMRTIPLQPLRVRARIAREGKRVQLVEATLFDGETEVARATGQRIRLEPGLDTGTPRPADEPLPPAPGESRGAVITGDGVPGYLRALEFVRGADEPGGAGSRTAWVRFRVPIVAGEANSPLMRLAGACDFASGIANALDFSRYQSINPDVSLHIYRYPESDWIALRGRTEIATDGTGQSEALVFDERGRIARAMTSLLVARVG